MPDRIDLANKAEVDALRLELRNALNGFSVLPYRVSDGPPTDAPEDGHLPTIDTTNSRLYIRANGAWRYTELGDADLGLTAEQLAALASVASKADQNAVDEALALKADQDDVATALATKVNSSTYTAGLANKADKTALDVETQARQAGDADALAAVADEVTARAAAVALKADQTVVSSLSEEVEAKVDRLVDAITARALSELRSFADWCIANGVKGHVGEVGWSRTTDTDLWNSVGESFYSMCDASDLWVTYWATGARWNPAYNLLAYGKTGSAVDTAYSPASVIENHLSTPRYKRGINCAGAEFTSAGFSNVNLGTSEYDTAATFTYLASRGIELVRIPFRWERMQPTLGGALDATELGKLTTAVNAAGAAGLKVILDCHNYAGYYTAGPLLRTIGDGFLTQAHFTDLWTRLSTAFKANASVIGYDLMNEPKGMTAPNSTYVPSATLASFDSTVNGWQTTSGGVWDASQGGSIRYTPAAASTTVGEADTSLRDRSAGGLSFWVDVYLPSNAVGNWDVALRSQNSAFAFMDGAGGSQFVRLTKGATTRLFLTLTTAQAQAMRGLIVQFGGTGRNGTDHVYIQAAYQGSLNADPRGAAGTWEDASAAAVATIRANADTKTIFVEGYAVFNAELWGAVHPKPWINDSNVIYSHHQYFDLPAEGGTYPTSYANVLAGTKALGWASAAVQQSVGGHAVAKAIGTAVDGRVSKASATGGAKVIGDQDLGNYAFRGFKSTPGFPTSGTYAFHDVVIDSTGAAWLCITGGTPGAWSNMHAGFINQVAQADSTAGVSRVSNGGNAVSLSSAPTTVPLVDASNFPVTGEVLFATPVPEDVVPIRVRATYTGKTDNSLTGVTVSAGSQSVPDGTPAYYAKSGLRAGAMVIPNQIIATSGIDGRPHDLVLVAAFDTSENHERGDYDIILTREAGSYGVVQINLPITIEKDLEWRDGLNNILLKLAAGQTGAANGDTDAPQPQGEIQVGGYLKGARGTAKNLILQNSGAASSRISFQKADGTEMARVDEGGLAVPNNIDLKLMGASAGQYGSILVSAGNAFTVRLSGSGGFRIMNSAFNTELVSVSGTGNLTVVGWIKGSAYATGSRPSASTAGVGAQIFDSTLGKPLWSNGSVWVDATGATV